MESEKITDLESEKITDLDSEEINEAWWVMDSEHQDIWYNRYCDADERSPEKKKMKMSLGESRSDVEGVKVEKSSEEEEEYEENMGDDSYLMDSSDEELSDSDKAVFYKYCRQMTKSGGFDLDHFPSIFPITHFALDPLEEGSERHRNVYRFSQIALNQYNSDHGTHYKFFKYVKTVWSLCQGEKYYITFEAKQDSVDAPTTFQALVWDDIPTLVGDEFIENIHVLLVRKKSEATKEHNRILLC